jgi:hypothetical protein
LLESICVESTGVSLMEILYVVADSD